MPTVAIASEFLDAFARIPRAQQRKVREFTEKFRTNPKGPGINYEKIHAVKDDKVRTVRIDQKYRAVILHPPEGDVYVLVWVDNPVEEVRAAVTVTPAKEAVNPEDLGTALENPDTRRRFVTIQSQDDLTSILNAPLAKWRVFLHPSQEKLVAKRFNGPARVLGG